MMTKIWACKRGVIKAKKKKKKKMKKRGKCVKEKRERERDTTLVSEQHPEK